MDLLAYLRATLEPTAEATKPATPATATAPSVVPFALLFKRKSTEVGLALAYLRSSTLVLFSPRASSRWIRPQLRLRGPRPRRGAGAHAPAVRPVQRKGTERVLHRAVQQGICVRPRRNATPETAFHDAFLTHNVAVPTGRIHARVPPSARRPQARCHTCTPPQVHRLSQPLQSPAPILGPGALAPTPTRDASQLQ